MNKVLPWLMIPIVIVLVIVWQSNTPTQQVSPDTQTVAATIYPLYDITRTIAGDTLRVELLLPVGASPHTYEPTPSLLQKLQNVSVIYAIGYGLDDWSQTIAESAGAQTQTVGDGIEMLASQENSQDVDPHYYLSFENAILITQTIARDLSSRFPDSSDVFSINAESYIQDLRNAQQEAQRIITQEIENKNLITLHDAWYYFSDDVGLKIVGTFEPSAGREPTPQYLIELTQALQLADVRVMYSEPQLDTQSLDAFIQDNNLTLAILDPLGGSDTTSTFIDMMLSNVSTIANNQ